MGSGKSETGRAIDDLSSGAIQLDSADHEELIHVVSADPHDSVNSSDSRQL